MDAKHVFSSILSDLIHKTRISINDLAKQSGVSRRQIFNYLAGTHQPTLDKFYKLIDVLGEDPKEIAGIISEKLKLG